MLRLIALLTALSFAVPAMAGELGDDGLHKAPWMRDTFKDLREDLTDASAEGKRLMILVEQRGCSYCRKMHEEVFVVPNVAKTIEDNFFVVQINMFGDVEVTDFDGTTLPEKEIVKRWGALFTPNIYFFPKSVPEGQTVPQAAVANMPGAFSASTTFDLLNWVLEDGYEGEEPFQKYHARKIQERGG